MTKAYVIMKILKLAVIITMLGGLMASCGPKPQYKTAKGKRKLRYYNDHQYDRSNLKDLKKF